ncbi:hypothetical protein V2G26_013626 [Clonostachys chloroleuca]|uniref:Uncharacterized protein n=1 Tax=Clonostachys chloroleuca TaxID=1926264 RepID=A0AA35M841_9HYPO|nr:unnamed protein product [Clonostachys chloroleuca]
MAPSRRSAKAAAEPHASPAVDSNELTVVEKITKTAELAVPKEITAVAKGHAARPTLPTQAQFPLAVALSFVTAGIGYRVLGELTNNELAAVTQAQDTWGEVAVLAGWKVFELAVGWFGNLDSLDVATMNLLSHGPVFYLLSTFYNLSPSTAISALLVDIASVALPFYGLRPLSAVHTPSAKVPNRELTDIGLQIYTAALATGIYTVVIVLSLQFLLPRVLILYFSHLPTLVPAYTASYATLLPVTVAFGASASNFIFAPFATTGKAREDERIGQFDPASASLGETVWWNVWGYTAKTKVVIRRTAITALVTGISTYLSCRMSIYGVEPTGAAVYAAVWVFAALFSGVGLGLVGGD